MGAPLETWRTYTLPEKKGSRQSDSTGLHSELGLKEQPFGESCAARPLRTGPSVPAAEQKKGGQGESQDALPLATRMET